MKCFFCSIDSSDGLRKQLAQTCGHHWEYERGVYLHKITDKDLGVSEKEFQRSRRIWADRCHKEPIHIVADDDCMPVDDFDVMECSRILLAHPDYAVLSLKPVNAHISDWTPEEYRVRNTPYVTEHESVGGVRFCRTGLLKDWPPMDELPGYDFIHAEALRKLGFRVGYFRSQKMLHLGEGVSTVWVADKMGVV